MKDVKGLNSIDDVNRSQSLEALFLWEGKLSRRRILELFPIRATRASQWILQFRERHPSWVVWNAKQRCFMASPEAYVGKSSVDAKRSANSESLNQYLALLAQPKSRELSSVVRTPWASFHQFSTPLPKTFATLSQAIERGQSVQIRYRSMRRPEPHKRIIAPHALVLAGRRWHVRAFCFERQEFRDFSLGRLSHVVTLDGLSTHTATEDVAWNTWVPVTLLAHPSLTHDQASVIRFEFFNDTSASTETCRGALVAYFIQDVRAATDTRVQRPPEFQLAVGNMTEVQPWLLSS